MGKNERGEVAVQIGQDRITAGQGKAQELVFLVLRFWIDALNLGDTFEI